MPEPAATSNASPRWACAELLLAGALLAAGLTVPHVIFWAGATPWLAAIGLLFLWWRGPGLRWMGLGRPSSIRTTVVLSLLVGVGFQLFGTFLLEPAIARLTSGELPDGSLFLPLVGDEWQLARWLLISWTLAGFAEEVVFRGWILTRLEICGPRSQPTAFWTPPGSS